MFGDFVEKFREILKKNETIRVFLEILDGIAYLALIFYKGKEKLFIGYFSFTPFEWQALYEVSKGHHVLWWRV